MAKVFGIRREDKNPWERRVPLTPEAVKTLGREHGIAFVVQPFPKRAFPDAAYAAAGARIDEDLSGCNAVLGVKEMPASLFRGDTAYVFFAHVIKGQQGNMPMLRALLEGKSHLLDYEKITDERGRRLVFFGRHAGLAGMIDALWALGRRLAAEGRPSPFDRIRQAFAYPDLEAAKADVREAGERIRQDGLDPALVPLVCGFTGYGNVSQGAQEIFDLLPVRAVAPEAIPGEGEGSPNEVYKAVFRESDLVVPKAPGASFVLEDYYARPEAYAARFAPVLPRLTVMINAVYWDARYPRFVTKDDLRALFTAPAPPRLRVIGDLSCDVEGSVEATVRATTPGDPVFLWDPARDEAVPGVEGKGPVILAVDNLPAEIPVESSRYFSGVLEPFVPGLAKADLSKDDPGLPGPLARSLIVHRGELTPPYRHLHDALKKAGA